MNREVIVYGYTVNMFHAKPLRECRDVEFLIKEIERLWKILDGIEEGTSTPGDRFKGDIQTDGYDLWYDINKTKKGDKS